MKGCLVILLSLFFITLYKPFTLSDDVRKTHSLVSETHHLALYGDPKAVVENSMEHHDHFASDTHYSAHDSRQLMMFENELQFEAYGELSVESKADSNKLVVPNVLIFGAQKGGTSSIARWLFDTGMCSPEIFDDEPYFFEKGVHFSTTFNGTHEASSSTQNDFNTVPM